MHGCLVTGTDTGVGKTIVSAAIVAALRAAGQDGAGCKPIVTGTDEAPHPPWPSDHELLAAVSGLPVADVNFVAYGPPVSPHLAAQLARRDIDPADLVARIRALGERHATLVVEGVGGLLVPLAAGYDVADLARALGLPLVIVARAGLGTINHTLLTLHAARARGLHVSGVVLNRWPAVPDVVQRSNRDTIADVGRVAVATFPELSGPDRGELARAGAQLPLADWLGHSEGHEPRAGREGAGAVL